MRLTFTFHCSFVFAILVLAAQVFPVVKGKETYSPSSTLLENPFSNYSAVVQQILSKSAINTKGFSRLAELCDDFGARLSGSYNLEAAIDWLIAEISSDGNPVSTQNVLVPHWVRGEEFLEMKVPRITKMGMLGLGGSIATPPEGITAEVLVVTSFDDLTAKAEKAAGKIVVFNVPFSTYGATVVYRTEGAIEAAKVGAVASLTRSITPASLYTPHTGSMSYSSNSSIPKIPAAAITVEDAELLQRLQDGGKMVVLHLFMEAHTLPDSLSRNIIAELKGSTYPEEVVVIGGHVDSWDVGTGANDDGGGILAAYETINVLRSLNLRPKRTIRAVFFTNEENGARGAEAYYQYTKNQINDTVFAMESDGGSFLPIGLSFTGTSRALIMLQQIADLLSPTLNMTVLSGGSGTDIAPLTSAGVPGAGLSVEGGSSGNSQYFWYHHTNADTIDKIDPSTFNQCLGAMAAISYVIAEMPETLPRN